MKKLLCLAVAAVAMATVGATEIQAQGCCGNNGFFTQNFGYNFNDSGFTRPPYFALFPPVYYSNQIVYRPIGISPFAATPGVNPVEFEHAANKAKIVKNPYFRKKAKAVKSKAYNDT